MQEPFEYPSSTDLNGQNGGFGFAEQWFEIGDPASFDQITAGSLRSSVLDVSGNSLKSQAPTRFATDLSRKLANTITGTAGTTVWVSFVMRRDSNGSAAPTPQDNYFGLVLYPTADNSDALFIGDTGETDFYSLGVAGSPAGQVASTTQSTVSSTGTLIVAKIDFSAGPDKVQLFINPDPSQPEPTTAAATKMDLDIADIGTIGILAGWDATWTADEIRIGKTFRDVAPEESQTSKLFAEESFNYPANVDLNGQNGGIGFGEQWFEVGDPADFDQVAPGSLHRDFLAVSGNSLNSRAPTRQATDLSRQLANTVAGTPGTTVWASFIMRKNTDGTAGAPPQDYFGLVLYPTDPSAQALFVGDTGETDFYSLGIAGSAAGQVPSTTVSKVSDTDTLLVVRIDFNPGADNVQLFINPDPSQPPPTSPAATKSDLDIIDIGTIGILGGLDATWTTDEIRLGRSFADVVPLQPKLGNISTRVHVETGDDVAIAGFIVQGDENKRVIVRAIGPSLAGKVNGPLQDPTLELHDQSGAIIAQNDNWRSSQEAEITATGLAPSDDRESAIVKTLPPGAYTAIVRGVNNTTGVGLAEVYDLSTQANTFLGNISTRGLVSTGEDVMIGGVIVTGDRSLRVVVRGIGPSLQKKGVADALQDPQIELRGPNGELVAANDDWQSNQKDEITATTLAPSDARESALVAVIAPGNYTGVLRGGADASGVGLIEFYSLP